MNGQKMQALQQFRSTFPKRPRCANDPTFDNRIRRADRAIDYRLVQANTAGLTTWLCFDIDRPHGAIDWQDTAAPAPNIVCQNPANGHAHLLYQLETPVCTSQLARLKPLQYAEAMERGLGAVLRADPAYGGNLVKNPLCGFWQVSSHCNTAYGLGELAEYVDPLSRAKRSATADVSGLGRNCETFERLRKLAYKQVREYWRPGGEVGFLDWCERAAVDMQFDFVAPLPLSEIRAISKSVARWCWRNFNPAEFRAVQAARGRRKGADKKAEHLPAVLEMYAAGHSNRLIADTVGLSHPTVGNWIKAALLNG